MRIQGLIALAGWAGGLLAAAGALEAAPLAGFTRVAESTHFVHFAHGSAKTNIKSREAQVARLEAALDVDIQGKIEYYAHERPEDIQAATGRYAAGYFFPTLGQIHATADAENHEIVHLVSHELGDPGPFFNEGLAVSLGNGDRFGGWPVDRVARNVLKRVSPEALEARFSSLQTSWEAVATAGSFVKWLGKRHGLPRVAQFFRASGRSGRPAAFEATFGQSLSNELQAWARSLGVKPPPVEPLAKTAQLDSAAPLAQPAR
jgi:hypothetical protein